MCVICFGLRIVDGEMARRAVQRIQLRRRMIRSGLAEIGIRRRAAPRTVIQTRPLLVEHRVVDVVVAVPRRLAAEVQRRRRHLLRRHRRRRIAHGQRHAADRVVHGIEHRQVVGAQLESRRRSARSALRRGLRRSVETSSCRYAFGSAQSHSVMTRLRSMPCGRGGAGGISPFGDASRPVGEHRERARHARATVMPPHHVARRPARS